MTKDTHNGPIKKKDDMMEERVGDFVSFLQSTFKENFDD
jgi:hypothetical protein